MLPVIDEGDIKRVEGLWVLALVGAYSLWCLGEHLEVLPLHRAERVLERLVVLNSLLS